MHITNAHIQKINLLMPYPATRRDHYKMFIALPVAHPKNRLMLSLSGAVMARVRVHT